MILSSLNNMKGRLGIPTDYYLKNTKIINSEIKAGKIQSAIPLINKESVFLRANGGYLQQERMIFDKKRSFDRTRLYSYQGANIVKYEENSKPVRALINPNKVKQDYDEKILSAPKEYGLQPGDIFEWLNTDTKWICYLQDITELAYFRSNIRKCQYEIAWEDEDGDVHRTYAAIRGPVETKIDFIQKHKTEVNNPNLSLNILMPKNEDTLKYFQRYSKFYLQDTNIGAPLVCWRVEAINWISMPGILEVNAVEYFANKDEDDIENGIVGGLIVDKISPNEISADNMIKGDIFIKPRGTYEYTYTGSKIVPWEIGDKKCPVQILSKTNNKIKLKWSSSYSGQFDLIKGDLVKTIVVESLF